MANIYLRSTDGNDADDGSTWALAKATSTGALAIATASDTIWFSQAHAESTAGVVTLTFPATPGLRILCGNDAAEPPTALATTGSVSVGAASSALKLDSGFAYIYGVIFNGSTNTSAAADIGFASNLPTGLVLDTCQVNIRSVHASADIRIGATASGSNDHILLEFINCSFKFGNISQEILLATGNQYLKGMSLDGAGSTPTTLFGGLSGAPISAVVETSDLSALSFTNLIDYSINTYGSFLVRNTKLPSGISVVTGTSPGPGGIKVKMHNCDSGDTNYRMAEHSYEGSVVTETTIVRTGGASDGTTTISWKMVSLANTEFWDYLVSPEMAIWNETTGSSVTVTIEIVNDGTTFQDDEIWLEVEYLGTAGFPQGTKISDRMSDILATAANQTTSSVTWTTTGLSSPIKQKLAVTFTPQEKGYFLAKVCLADPSKTVYVDPLLTVT